MIYKDYDGSTGVEFCVEYESENVFQRECWQSDLRFAYNHTKKHFGYCKTHRGYIEFDGSKVGESVLKSIDIVEIKWRKDMKKEEIGTLVHTVVAAVIGKDCEKKEKKIKWFAQFFDVNDEPVSDGYFANKKDVREFLKRNKEATHADLFRKTVKLSIDLPIKEEEV